MCLVVIAWRVHPRYPLIVAANRDEFHARPTAPLAHWSDPIGMVAGRDLQAGGTWLGLDHRGRVGIITNFRERLRPRRNVSSRGTLIPRFLSSEDSPAEYLAELETEAPGLSGFNLLLVTSSQLWYASNRMDEFARPLAAGVFGLANQSLDSPWPKVLRVRARMERWIADDARPPEAHARAAATTATAADELFDILRDTEPAPVAGELTHALTTGLPAEWERAVSAPFVVHPEYGTRCSTVLLTDRDGGTLVAERSFAPDGKLTLDTRIHVETVEPAPAPATLT
jgi:uncharacterized protein with NRDE domain